MSSMSTVKKRIIISMFAIVLLLITLFGITYAYFTAKIQGNKEDKSISVTAGSLKLEYDGEDSYISVTGLRPSENIESKKFSVKNTGKNTVENYDVILENVVNELEDYEDLTYELVCTSSDGTECNGGSGIFPKGQEVLTTNTIEPDVKHSYVLTLTYSETYTNQSHDMNKEISARVNIKDNVSNIKNFKIYGNTIQNGIASPNNLIELLSVGEQTKNLFDYSETPVSVGSYMGHLLEKEDYTMKIELKPGKTIPEGVYFGFVYFNTSSQASANWFISNGQLNYDEFYIDLSVFNKSYVAVYSDKGNKSAWNSILDAYNITLVKDFTEKLTYEPFGKYKIPLKINNKLITNIYLDEPLRKVGDYADYMDFENGKIVRNIGYKEIDSNSIFGKSGSSTESFNYYFINFDNAKVGNDIPIMSNIGGGNFREFNSKNKYGIFTNQNSTFFIAFPDITTLEGAREFVTNNKVYSNYVLKNPIEEVIDLPEFQIVESDTITLGTNVSPSNIEIEFDN